MLSTVNREERMHTYSPAGEFWQSKTSYFFASSSSSSFSFSSFSLPFFLTFNLVSSISRSINFFFIFVSRKSVPSHSNIPPSHNEQIDFYFFTLSGEICLRDELLLTLLSFSTILSLVSSQGECDFRWVIFISCLSSSLLSSQSLRPLRMYSALLSVRDESSTFIPHYSACVCLYVTFSGDSDTVSSWPLE